jgi:hypothetical protein
LPQRSGARRQPHSSADGARCPPADAASRRPPRRCPRSLSAAPAPEQLPVVTMPAPPSSQAMVAPLAPERFRVQLTISRETRDKLDRIQALARHAIPDGDLAAIFDRALTLLLNEFEQRRCAATESPRQPREAPGRSRRIPAAVKREVWRRDGGRCAFVGHDGRCAERSFLEYHHVHPYAGVGSPRPRTSSSDAERITHTKLRCSSGNRRRHLAPAGRAFVGVPAWLRARPALILEWTLDRVDNDDIYGCALRFQLQTQLFLERNE